MNATILWPVVVAIVGVCMFVFASNPKVNRLGEIAFFVGLFWAVYLVAGKAALHF